MEEIEYLEEYEDLILPMSFAVDDGKCNEGLDSRKSIDSLEMLYKDLIEESSLQQNEADTSPFSLNPQMVSPEKTILSSSTLECGMSQSYPNYSMNAAHPSTAYVNTTHTDPLQPSYQVQTSSIQYLNRVTNKSFSSYSSLQKPDKHKSVATVKPTLQRVNNPPKQYIQRESPIFKTVIPGQSSGHQSQNIFSKPSSAKITLGVGTSSKSKSAVKISKRSASNVDSLAGLVDDALLDFDERNGLADAFGFDSDLENSIIAGLSDMDSDSVDLSEEFIDDNFDLESDLSSEGSDLKKALKRKRSQLSSQESPEHQNTKAGNDMKRDASNSVKKKLPQQIQKSLTADLHEKLPTSSSSVGSDPPFVVYSTKVNEAVAKGNNIFTNLPSKLNDLEQAHVSNVLNLNPTVPLYSKAAEKPENGWKQLPGLTATATERSSHQKKDDQTYAVDPFRGCPETLPAKPTVEVVKRNLFEPPAKNPETSVQKDGSTEKPARLKFGSLYLRAIKPPTLKHSPIKPAAVAMQQTNPGKAPAASQPPKAAEEIWKTSLTQHLLNNCSIVNTTVPHVSKTSQAAPCTPDASKITEKGASVPKTLEAMDKKKEPTDNAKVLTQLKRPKSLVALNAPKALDAKSKSQESTENVKVFTQLKRQKSMGSLNALKTSEAKDKSQGTTEPLKRQKSFSALNAPKALEAKDKRRESSESVKVFTKLKSQKSLGALNVSVSDKESASVKNKESVERPKAQAQPRAQQIEPNSKKESINPQTQEAKQSNSIAKPKAQIKSITPKAAQEAKKDGLSELRKAQPHLKQKGHAEEKKTNPIMKSQDVSDATKEQSHSKPKGTAAEKIAPKFEKANVNTKTQEPKDRVTNETAKVPSPSKVRYIEEKTPAALDKSSKLPINELKERDMSEKRKSHDQIRQRKHGFNKNRNKSEDQTANIQAPATEINEKQATPVQKIAADKGLEKTTSSQSGEAQVKTEKMLLNTKTTFSSQSDKEPPLQKSHETSLQMKNIPSEQEISLLSQRRKRLGKRTIKGQNSERKEPSLPREAPEPPTVQSTGETAQKPPTADEPQKQVISSQITVPQALQKDTPQRLQTITPSSSRQAARMSSKANSAKLARQLKSISSSKSVSREQKKINLRQFKICLDRKTVDHFMKSLKGVVSSTPQTDDNKGSELNVVKSEPSNDQVSQIIIPRGVGRPRKNFSSNSEQKVLGKIEPQPPVSSNVAVLPTVKENEPKVTQNQPKVTENQPKVDENASLEVNSGPTLKRRKRKKTRPDLPAKVLRSDKTDNSDIPKKECTNDPVPLKKQCLADGSTSGPSEAPILADPLVTSKSGEPDQKLQITTSPSVPTVGNSPTFPTDAASPATPTDDGNMKAPKSMAESPSSPGLLRKRAKPYSKKHARRAALARRLELIRQSTSQRLPCTPAPEEPTPEPAAVERHTDVAGEGTTSAMASPASSAPSAQTNEQTSQTKKSATSQRHVQVNEAASPSTPQAAVQTKQTVFSDLQTRKTKSLAASQPLVQTVEASSSASSQTPVQGKKTKSLAASQLPGHVSEKAAPSTPHTDIQTNKATSSDLEFKKTRPTQHVEAVSSGTSQTPVDTSKTTPSIPAIEATSQPPAKSSTVSVTCQPPIQSIEADSSINESATFEPLVQAKQTTSPPATSQPPDGSRLTSNNLVQPKLEIHDPQAGVLGTTIFDGAPAMYSFARPADTSRRNSQLFLDACQISAISFDTEQYGATESVAVYDLPSYIVMRTRIITRGELPKTKTTNQPKVAQKPVNKLPETGNSTPVVKEEAPDFKDICLEINTLLGRNANYLKFASASERQARMNQVLSDSSLSVQEAQSALKFLQSYLAARSKDVAANNAKGQQFIPIYDSQKKVIGYRKRRVQPKKSPPSMELNRKSGRLAVRSSNSSTSRTTCATPIQQMVVQFSAKEEPQTIDTGDEELIVPDLSLSENAIKSEHES